jgi:hypothetical protein
MSHPVVKDEFSYTVQELNSGRVIAEADVIGGAKAIATAKSWARDWARRALNPYSDESTFRILADGEIVWPNELRCDTCGAYLTNGRCPY